jgi:uncharacterized protein (TIGR02147 family)
MVTPDELYRNLLMSEFKKRTDRNPRYSLRSFGRTLDISAATLSRVFNKKSCLSLDQAEKAADRLGLGPQLRKNFISSVVRSQKSRSLKRQDPRIRQFSLQQYVQPVTNEDYALISEWFYAAILEMTFLPEFRMSAAWVASQLEITVSQASLALQRLRALGYIAKNSEGKWIKSTQHLTTQDKSKTEPALKKKQIAIRNKAIDAIQNSSLKSRKMTTITMAIDPALLPEAFKRIEQFNQSLCEFLESGNRKQVYVMEIGLFSLTKSKMEET